MWMVGAGSNAEGDFLIYSANLDASGEADASIHQAMFSIVRQAMTTDR